MTYTHYDRLTALDASFLALEDHNTHMHVGSIGLFDAEPLRGAHGGLDMERVMAMADTALGRHARFRQKLAYVPGVGDPVWVDDEHFNLHYHVRHTALPPPGDERQLKRLAGRIMSQQLDRGKPLWELWYVEGVSGNRFAIITKIHHCMVDGISGADLMAAMMQPDRNAATGPAPRWLPRPAPGPARLLAEALRRRASLPLDALRGAGALIAEPGKSLEAARDALESMAVALSATMRPASPTPLNGDVGPHRRFDWTKMDLERVKAIKRRYGATINDVVLAIVAGALRRFLRARGEQLEDRVFRAMVPLSVRTAEGRGRLGNQVSFLMAPLPLAERDPEARLQSVIATMRDLKSSKQGRGGKLLEEVSDRLSSGLFAQLARFGARRQPYNIVVTNVPGPPFPVYLLGAPLREVYPVVPLFTNQTLGIALFSYDGGLFWGFNADWDAIPDLHDLVGFIDSEFLALHERAGIDPAGVPARLALPRRSAPTPRRRPRRAAGRRRAAAR